jgi:hypothetical protein
MFINISLIKLKRKGEELPSHSPVLIGQGETQCKCCLPIRPHIATSSLLVFDCHLVKYTHQTDGAVAVGLICLHFTPF